MVKEFIPMALAVASFLLSLYTLWVTQLRRGQLKMTRPTLICLKREMPSCRPKIFLRTLFFGTAIKGRVVENMFLRVRQPFGEFTFNFWGRTEAGKLTLGSGLFVGQTGVACDHHFNPNLVVDDFIFGAGEYRIEIFATTVGNTSPTKLMEVSFAVDGQQAAELIQILDTELYRFWNADTKTYDGRTERLPKQMPTRQEIGSQG